MLSEAVARAARERSEQEQGDTTLRGEAAAPIRVAPWRAPQRGGGTRTGSLR